MNIPFYLQSKLQNFSINSVNEVKQFGYCAVFAWLRDKYPNTSYNTLYDLYCLNYDLPLNSLGKSNLDSIKQSYLNSLPCYIPLIKDTIDRYLNLALEISLEARAIDEIPIGALIVKDDKIIATGYNTTRSTNNSIKHAEVVAINKAQEELDSLYLYNCDLYVTIEPCLMCSGVIINSRVKRVIFGAIEPKTGAVTSQYQVFNNKNVNHHTQVIGPLDNKKYSRALSEFLKAKR